VCVCAGTRVCVHVSTSLESPPIMGNSRCDWAPISNRFYLVYTFKTKWSRTRDGFRGLLMRGEGVRHPTTSVKKRLPPF
jgi:hypothetical protein